MLRRFAPKWFDLTPIDSVCVISKQAESLRFNLSQKTPNSFNVRQKGPDLVGARKSFVATKLQALRATSLTFAPLHLIDVLNAFGLFARADRDHR